jgi:hypothetical protein
VKTYSTWAERFLSGLEGPISPRWLSNAHCRIVRWTAEGLVLPLLEAEGKIGDAGICSVRTHYADYAREVVAQVLPTSLRYGTAAMLRAAGMLIDRLRLGHCVFVGHWLLPANPLPPLDAGRIDSLTGELCRRYPDRSLIIRSLNRTTAPGLLNSLRGCGYVPVRSRRIWIFDPHSRQFRHSRDVRNDLRLLASSPHVVEEGMRLSRQDVERIHTLYRRLYLGKHSLLNPAYTPAFLCHLMEREVLEFRVFRHQGRIDAFTCWFEQGSSMTGAIIGYDLERPQQEGLLRQAMAVELERCLSGGKVLNLGAGNGHFKACRGGCPELEFDAVYCEHLPVAIRAAWRWLAALLKWGERLMGLRDPAIPPPRKSPAGQPATDRRSPTGSRLPPDLP